MSIIQGCFWKTFGNARHTHKDDRVLLEPAVKAIFDHDPLTATVALRTILIDPDNRAMADAITPEPCDPESETIRRRDLLQLCWAISHDIEYCQSQDYHKDMHRTVISKFYSLYGGEPLWLMTLPGWTFPEIPKVEPCLLGLTYLYEDDSIAEFHLYDDTAGWSHYLSREDAELVLEGVVGKIKHNPPPRPDTMSFEEAQQYAKKIGRERAAKRKLHLVVADRCDVVDEE